MPPKRKSDAVDLPIPELDGESDSEQPRAVKKARLSTSKDASSSKTTKVDEPKPESLADIKLEGEDDNSVCIYDDCNEVRRKIRLLQKTPGWKVTHWLKAVGGINQNSFTRFMAEKGPEGGCSNGTYSAAYVYLEKQRIFEGKPKTAKRRSNEIEHPNGFSLTRSRGVWIMARR